jgi:hypothetical protein
MAGQIAAAVTRAIHDGNDALWRLSISNVVLKSAHYRNSSLTELQQRADEHAFSRSKLQRLMRTKIDIYLWS